MSLALHAPTLHALTWTGRAPPDLRRLRNGAALLGAALQVLGLAGTLWLFAAAPGLLADQASTAAIAARR